jgi:hypothetical protein
MSALSTKVLSPAAIEVLGQLFSNGPTWDGNICSKSGRGELFALSLCDRTNGFAFLTRDGVELATEWDLQALRNRHYQGWYKKASCQ